MEYESRAKTIADPRVSFFILIAGAILLSSCATVNSPKLPFPSDGSAFVVGDGAFGTAPAITEERSRKFNSIGDSILGTAPAIRSLRGVTIRPLSKQSTEGILTLGNNQKLEYGVGAPISLPLNFSLEVEYAFCLPGGGKWIEPDPALIRVLSTKGQMVLETGGLTWVLPLDTSILGLDIQPARIRYVLPVSSLEKINVSWVPFSKDTNEAGNELAIKIIGLRLTERWYGFSLEADRFSVTPFVSAPDVARVDGLVLPSGLAVEPPDIWRIQGRTEFAAGGHDGNAIITETGPLRFGRYERSAPNQLFIPSGSLPAEPWPLTVKSEGGIASLRIYPAPTRPFPGEPIPADPGIILNYPQEAWRSTRYEIFRWDNFPSVLIFDFADYAVQDQFLKRLAFYVEKAEFRGRLAEDREIAKLHGWNAHDYHPRDLAAFFEAARIAQFPLLPEERELEELLVKSSIIKRDRKGVLSAGEGAIVSISRESPDYLRFQLLTHEAFHGLFFIDEDFREFSRLRWENLSPVAKRFIYAFFDRLDYDTKDTNLMINELMAYCLQQTVSQASQYFGETQAGRLAADPLWQKALPPKDEATGTWPEIADAFSAEAEAFSAYVDHRWGLAAGAVGQVRVRNRP